MLSSALLHDSTWEVAAYTHLGTMYTPLQIAIMAYRRIADKQACKGRRQQGAERLHARELRPKCEGYDSLQVTSTGQRMQAAINISRGGWVRRCIHVQQPYIY